MVVQVGFISTEALDELSWERSFDEGKKKVKKWRKTVPEKGKLVSKELMIPKGANYYIKTACGPYSKSYV